MFEIEIQICLHYGKKGEEIEEDGNEDVYSCTQKLKSEAIEATEDFFVAGFTRINTVL